MQWNSSLGTSNNEKYPQKNSNPKSLKNYVIEQK